MTDKEYVCEHWKIVEESIYDPHEGYTIPQTRIDFGSHHYTERKANSAWSAAAEFTRERLEQIRQVEREIEVLEPFAEGRMPNKLEQLPPWANPVLHLELLRRGFAIRRILAREQATLAELRKGMR